MRYFIKELPEMSVYDRNGVRIPFVVIGGGYGLLELDETTQSELIEDLNKMSGTRGVRKSTEGENSLLKGKHPLRPSASRSSLLAVAPDRNRGFKPNPVAPVAAAEVRVNTAPAVIPLTAPAPPLQAVPEAVQPKGFKPRMGKAKKTPEAPPAP